MHPWLTALSVVGGIYYFGGVTGAICGPLVLCAVFVTLSLFPSLASFYDSAAAAGATATAKTKSAHVSTPFVQRSESVC